MKLYWRLQSDKTSGNNNNNKHFTRLNRLNYSDTILDLNKEKKCEKQKHLIFYFRYYYIVSASSYFESIFNTLNDHKQLQQQLKKKTKLHNRNWVNKNRANLSTQNQRETEITELNYKSKENGNKDKIRIESDSEH